MYTLGRQREQAERNHPDAERGAPRRRPALRRGEPDTETGRGAGRRCGFHGRYRVGGAAVPFREGGGGDAPPGGGGGPGGAWRGQNGRGNGLTSATPKTCIPSSSLKKKKTVHINTARAYA